MSNTDQLDALINQLVHANDPEEVKVLYRQWAATYDNDLDSFGYVAPQIGTALFCQLLADTDAKIHDAGCGTGLVGKLLHSLGYTNIDGSDFSADMLKKARDTGTYKQLLQADYTQTISLQSDTYDGVISIGVYTKRFKQHFLGEMLRIIKPGGYLLFSCRPLYYEEVANLVMQLHLDGSIETSSVTEDDYMKGQGAKAFYVALKKSTTNAL